MFTEASEERGGVLVSMTFGGHVLRSDMSEDEICMEVSGMTTKDLEKNMRETRTGKEAKRTETEAKISERIKAGEVLVFAEKRDEWRE